MSWHDHDYVVPADRRMRAIGAVESVITLVEIERDRTKGALQLSKVATAYSIMLNFGGAQVTAEEVYEGMFGSPTAQSEIIAAVTGLLAFMLPPAASVAADKDKSQMGNPPRRTRRAAARSSKKHTKRRAAGGA